MRWRRHEIEARAAGGPGSDAAEPADEHAVSDAEYIHTTVTQFNEQIILLRDSMRDLRDSTRDYEQRNSRWSEWAHGQLREMPTLVRRQQVLEERQNMLLRQQEAFRNFVRLVEEGLSELEDRHDRYVLVVKSSVFFFVICVASVLFAFWRLAHSLQSSALPLLDGSNHGTM